MAAACLLVDAAGKSLTVASRTKVRIAIIDRTKLKSGEAIQDRLSDGAN